nr:ATP-binding protein [Motilibacter deserti]
MKTDAQVIARVTDGIYSEPASAFRELISNSYDADAKRVVITTDRPRFQRITVSDDGHGMGPDAVAHLIEHIGGSAKRTEAGAGLGVTKPGSAFLSPGGRRLIGKIGIGLFSVSQLTQSFQVITKRKDEAWRTVVSVTLRQYSENEQRPDSDEPFEAGLVAVWREPAQDTSSQGTTVVLNGLKPTARKMLRSSDTWLRVRRGIQDAPKYHVGAVQPGSEHEFAAGAAGSPRLPWAMNDSPDVAFARFVDAVTYPESETSRNPKISDLLDYYLQMVWRLSLAAPLPYVHQHPFDDVLENVVVHDLVGSGPDSVVRAKSDLPVATRWEWPAGLGVASDFHVFLDELELKRPLKFKDLPETSNQVKTPMMFVGHLLDDFNGADPARSGGALEFYAYLLWVPKIVPTDEVGSLVRIHGASGSGFDETFFKYQVAETTRLRQITCEIFVVQGLEAALNIDRENYNFGHPHVGRLTNWLHMALSRSIGTQKSYGNALRRELRAQSSRDTEGELERLVDELWSEVLGSDADTPIPPVRWTSGIRREPGEPGGLADEILLSRQKVLGSQRSSAKAVRTEAQVAAIAQMLSAFQMLDDLSASEIQLLMSYIARAVRPEAQG